jgi:hypothetical protein
MRGALIGLAVGFVLGKIAGRRECKNNVAGGEPRPSDDAA